ncbi:hypothetical protein [Ruegeria sp.]
MPTKVFDFLTLLPAFLGKALGTCTRMQQRVNRQHNSLTVETVKRPGLDN